MNLLPRNVWVLTLCQALMTSCASLVVFSGSLVGNRLAPDEKLSTLPVALFVIGTATSTVPVALAMQRFGRKKIFLTVALLGVTFALGTAQTINHGSFYLFCLGVFLLGSTIAAVQQFRFAAMESVSTGDVPRAASQVLLGGIVSAILGPEVAVWGKDLLSTEYAGSFVLLAALYIGSLVLLSQFQNTASQEVAHDQVPRPLKIIASQQVFWVAVLAAVIGYSVMSFIMTATPISMHVMDGHDLVATKRVIQSHILAMFLPSFFTAWIIKRFGIIRMMVGGIGAYVLCLVLAYSGHGFLHYWSSLVLLGVGWNFLFIGGTTLLPASYRPEERFKVQGLNEFLVFGSQAVASTSAGWVLFQFGWETLLLVIIPLLAGLSIIITLHSLKKRAD